MGPKKGRRVRRIQVPTDSVREFELRHTVADIQWRKQEGGQREGTGTKMATEGEQEGGGKSGGNTFSRGRSCRGKARNGEKCQRNRGWRRGMTITVTIQKGAHDQHLSHRLR